MEFKGNLSIFQQIANSIRDDIMIGVYRSGDKLPSVREMATQIGVNPNTVMRSYAYLQDLALLTNKRGIGFFVSEHAADHIKQELRKEFLELELPLIIDKLNKLEIDKNLLIQRINDLTDAL